VPRLAQTRGLTLVTACPDGTSRGIPGKIGQYELSENLQSIAQRFRVCRGACTVDTRPGARQARRAEAFFSVRSWAKRQFLSENLQSAAQRFRVCRGACTVDTRPGARQARRAEAFFSVRSWAKRQCLSENLQSAAQRFRVCRVRVRSAGHSSGARRAHRAGAFFSAHTLTRAPVFKRKLTEFQQPETTAETADGTLTIMPWPWTS
jgi:hypothetical protein